MKGYNKLVFILCKNNKLCYTLHWIVLNMIFLFRFSCDRITARFDLCFFVYFEGAKFIRVQTSSLYNRQSLCCGIPSFYTDGCNVIRISIFDNG